MPYARKHSLSSMMPSNNILMINVWKEEALVTHLAGNILMRVTVFKGAMGVYGQSQLTRERKAVAGETRDEGGGGSAVAELAET